MQYDHCMTFSCMKNIRNITFFPLSPTLVIYCLDAELLRLPGCWKNTDYILRYDTRAVGLLLCRVFLWHGHVSDWPRSLTKGCEATFWIQLLAGWLGAVSTWKHAYGLQICHHGCGNGVAFLTRVYVSLILTTVGAYHLLSFLHANQLISEIWLLNT